MNKKNERYNKVYGHRPRQQHGIDLHVVGSNVEFSGTQGQEVKKQEKKSLTVKMPKKNVKTKSTRQHQFLTLNKVAKKEKLANIKLRLLLLKYVYKWQQKTFGNVLPSKARRHYKQKLLKRSFQQWEDVWWNGRNEWKLNIRADYHNRFRMWLKVWRGWRSFLLLKKIKKTKLNFAKQKADRILLTKSLGSWKNYVGERRSKKQFYLQAREEGEIVVKRMAFSKWKNLLKFKQQVHSMEERALHFWAWKLVYKAWQCWLYHYSFALEEKHKLQHAAQLHNRKLAFKVLHSFKLYGMQRNLKKLRLSSGVRFYRLQKLRDAFLKWKIVWNRKRELMKFEDTVQSKGKKARKQRMFTHWKHLFFKSLMKDIVLCQYKRQNEYKSWNHFETHLQMKCMKALQKRVENQRRTAVFNITATKFYKTSLTRRFWMSWLGRCEERDDHRQISLINFVRNHHRKSLLRKMLRYWKYYCEQQKLKQNQKLKADIHARRNMLPRFFSQWEAYVDLVKTRHVNQERAKAFRRECLLAKTFYRWLQEYRLALDVQMLYRMAIISYDGKLKKEFFQLWLTRARQRIRENRLLARSGTHYQLQLKKKCFETWREYIKHLNYGSVRLSMAVQHQNKKLLSICWKYWTTFVVRKREKWRLFIRADLHYHQRILRKLIGNWKLYSNNMKEIKSFAEEKKTVYDKKTLRILFYRWKENAQYLKTTRQNCHASSQHWKNKTKKKVFVAWRIYAEERSWRKQQELFSIVEARKRLDRGILHRTLHLWKKEYLLKMSSKQKWSKATEHWKRCVLKNAFGIFKKYRFLGYRKQVLRQQCMLYHNERIIASHWEIWRSRYAERVAFLKKSHMALWMWSFTLQRKAFVSWFYYAEEKKRKKLAITKALERRQQWLHKVTVIQWIKFATYFIAERERFAATRHVQLSQNVQQSVQRCAVHWRRKTARNRAKRRKVASQPLSAYTHKVSHKAISTEDKRNTSKTLPMGIAQYVSAVRRPQPRVPDYLRESFNLSELSEHVTCSATDNEAVPRHLPSNLEPVTQPEHFPEPSSITSRTSSNTGQTGLREMLPVERSSRNPQTFSRKVDSGKKHVLLPPSSFLRTKKSVNTAQENTQENTRGKKTNGKQESKKVDGRSRQEIQNGFDRVNIDPSNDNSVSDGIPSFLSDKNSQQSIVHLRNRMLKYYTISTHLRELRRKLTSLRQWSRDSSENGETLSLEERSLVQEIVNELSENVESTSLNLEESYKTIANDLQQLLDKVS